MPMPAFRLKDGNPKSMDAITVSDVDDFIRTLEADKSGAVIAKVCGVASSMWSDGLRDGIVSSNPWIGRRTKPHNPKAPIYMSPDQYHAIVDAIGEHWKLLVTRLGETGLRMGEATRLQPGDIIGSVVYVRESKNGKSGSVPISAALANELQANLRLLANGASLTDVRDRLGHSRIAITSKYLHALPDTHQRTLGALDKALGRSSEA